MTASWPWKAKDRGNGERRKEVGLLLGSDNALALDRTVCRILDLEPDHVPTLRAARELELLDDSFTIDGPLDPVRPFRLPQSAPSLLYGPQSLQRLIRLHFLPQTPSSMPISADSAGPAGQSARPGPSTNPPGLLNSTMTGASAAAAASRFVPTARCIRWIRCRAA
ncbi:hypothetical cytosolic protein [Syntrophus aciditrophicus SB]|uniref:Hypothetical cytosolic protein n=1 Tax=Syntrophus aciditrophicus (strain SB) TaxID=56780 RepID=Q2LWW7_SYNAS|nr:hypothetical cytosolic protein [Syntrophus aciditrophicus SB]